MAKLLYKKESYKIVGCCFEVYNQLGYGLREKNYQSAIEEILTEKKIKFEKQLHAPLKINGKIISSLVPFVIS